MDANKPFFHHDQSFNDGSSWLWPQIGMNDRQKWAKTLRRGKIPAAPAGSMKAREISTAWAIICSNGGPSAGNKSPGLFCTVSSNDWPTFVPRRQSQLKVPSVKRRRRSLLSLEGKCTLTLAPQFIVTGFLSPLLHLSVLSSFSLSV